MRYYGSDPNLLIRYGMNAQGVADPVSLLPDTEQLALTNPRRVQRGGALDTIDVGLRSAARR
jgi:hypothetical protein